MAVNMETYLLTYDVGLVANIEDPNTKGKSRQKHKVYKTSSLLREVAEVKTQTENSGR